MKKIGIIGRGFVGSAVEFGFSAQTGCSAIVKVYDKDSRLSSNSLDETVNTSDYIFVSVPTPSNQDGSINLDVLEEVLESLNDINIRNYFNVLCSHLQTAVKPPPPPPRNLKQ